MSLAQAQRILNREARLLLDEQLRPEPADALPRVDIEPQPNYCGEEFFQLDALEVAFGLQVDVLSMLPYEVGDFAAVHASPPCPVHSSLNGWSGDSTSPDLIPQTRERLRGSGLPYVIENVPGAPLENPVQICGQALGLKVRRHRLFEANFPIMVPQCQHPEPPVIVVGGSIGRKVFDPRRKAIAPSFEQAKEVMEMPWAKTRQEVVNAIPPAYTRHVAGYLLTSLSTPHREGNRLRTTSSASASRDVRSEGRT